MPNNYLPLLACLTLLVLLPSPAAAFGAGNIASISRIEGQNWRHGDIEDMLATVACIRGLKWSSMMIKRTYFGNWLRDYSQAVDVGTLKGVQADTIRVLIWVLSFMSFGYGTEEFEVTAERLGVYRPEEHIDNPKDYADNVDARQYDPRLRGPVAPIELAIDPNTGMKNYIANESGGWATSFGYVKFSFARSIHFGRLYTSGVQRGREADLCEALRCLGQGLHCLEDFGAHTNYTELALRELGYMNVFPYVGTNTLVNLRGKQVFPLVTGTFGGVDFLHSVLGEATDHVTQSEVNQSEVDQLNQALGQASASHSTMQRAFGDRASTAGELTDMLQQVPGTGHLVQEAFDLQAASDAQAVQNERDAETQNLHAGQGYDSNYTPYADDYSGSARINNPSTFQAPPGSQNGPPGPGIHGVNVNIDPQQAIAKIYPFLAFRDKVVRQISSIISKIPGLEKLIDTISEKVTLFIMGLLAPFVKPVIAAASNALKQGSGSVVHASAQQQFLIWQDPTSTDPTHSMLSKDHFSNILNPPAGRLAAVILQYVAPRILYGWENPDVPIEEIFQDVGRVFHHPATRDENFEIHREMFATVEIWARERQQQSGAMDLNVVLSSESVKAGKNHVVQNFAQSVQPLEQQVMALGSSSHSATAGGPMAQFFGGGGGMGMRGMDYANVEAEGSNNGREGQDAGGYGYSGGSYDASSATYGQGLEQGYEGYGQQQQYQQRWG